MFCPLNKVCIKKKKKELYDFYTELHCNRDSPNHKNASDAFPDYYRLPALNEDAKEICEGVLTKTECFKALETF